MKHRSIASIYLEARQDLVVDRKTVMCGCGLDPITVVRFGIPPPSPLDKIYKGVFAALDHFASSSSSLSLALRQQTQQLLP